MPPKRVLGPLDKRKRLTRCQGCAARKIKCEGGIPCAHCRRVNKECVAQRATEAEFRFVALDVVPPQAVTEDVTVRFLDSFTSFLRISQFTRQFQSLDLGPLMRGSAPLRLAAVTIGALHASRHATTRAAREGEPSPYCAAVSSYRDAIQALQARLGEEDAVGSEDVLWATFLLGLFELMSDVTGDNWAKHMLYGTGRILTLAGPESVVRTPLGRTFIDVFFLLDAGRAVLCGDNTLAYEERVRVRQLVRSSYGVLTSEEPLERVSDLMVHASSFSAGFFNHIVQLPDCERREHPIVQELSGQAAEAQVLLRQCHDDVILPQLASGVEDPFLFLAAAFQRAILLVVSAGFATDDAPSLLQICDHVAAIIDLAGRVVHVSNLSAALLIFPLRVAGSYALDRQQRMDVIALLDQVYWKGFVCSFWIKEELRYLWESQAVPYA